ncbi:MAG: glycogen debranching enzyme, partial [Mycobacterium leprae]
RNILLTLLTSIGVPMLRMGDEVGHTQHGNNNPYCQDNELTWLDWEPADAAERDALLEFARALIHLRRSHQVFRRRRFFVGRPGHHGALKDLAWFAPDGEEMSAADWFSPVARTLGMYLAGDSIRQRGPRGERVVDDSFLLLLHAGADPCAFRLPSRRWGREYELVVDTADESTPGDTGGAPVCYAPGTEVKLVAHSAALFRAVR